MASRRVSRIAHTPPEDGEDHGDHHQELVAERPLDDSVQHGVALLVPFAARDHLLDRLAEVGLGVDEELGGGDDLVSRLEAGEDLDVAVPLAPQRRPRAARSDPRPRRRRRGCARPSAGRPAVGTTMAPLRDHGVEPHGGVHARAQPPVGFGTSSVRGTVRVFSETWGSTKRTRPREGLAREVAQRDVGDAADLEPAQLVLEDLDGQPQRARGRRCGRAPCPGFTAMPSRPSMRFITTPLAGAHDGEGAEDLPGASRAARSGSDVMSQ